MQAGSLTSGDVSAFTSRVLVDGVQQPVESWSVDRELSGDLPQTVASGSGITQATGTVKWGSGADVATPGLNPWNKSTGWLPGKGQKVEILAGDGVSEWMVFTGIVDSTTGGGGSAQSRIVDRIDDLSGTLTLPTLLSTMPPATAGGDYRPCGLSSSFYVDWAMRAGGYFTTPRQESNAVLHVPMQTSMWPHTGTLTRVGRYAGEAQPPYNAPAPWGWCMNDFQGFYTPSSGVPVSADLQVTVCVAPSHAGAFLLTAYYGTSNRVEVGVNASRTVFVTLDGTNVANLPMGSATIATALFAGGSVEIRTNDGAASTAALTRAGAELSSVRILGDSGARIAGVQVSAPATAAQRFASMGHRPTAIMDMSSPQNNGVIDAARAFQDVKAIDLLTEISKATLSGMWFDETGVLRFVPTLALRSRNPARTVTTLEDITDLSWEDSYLGSASRVKIAARMPAIAKAKQASITVWQGSRDTMESGEEREMFIEPDSGTDWVQPDYGLTVLKEGNWGTFNLRRGTFAGAYFSGDAVTVTGFSFTATLEQIGVNKCKITNRVGTLPTNVVANLSTPPENAMWPGNELSPLPRVGAYGLVTWSDITVSPVTAAGIGPELEHDAGEWNSQRTGTSGLERMAQYLAAWLAGAKPVITSLGVIADPRIQLGDVITIDSPSLYGVRIDALATGVSMGFDGGGLSMSLSVRVLSAVTTFETFEEYEKSLPGNSMTFTQWGALAPTTQTFTEFNNTA